MAEVPFSWRSLWPWKASFDAWRKLLSCGGEAFSGLAYESAELVYILVIYLGGFIHAERTDFPAVTLLEICALVTHTIFPPVTAPRRKALKLLSTCGIKKEGPRLSPACPTGRAGCRFVWILAVLILGRSRSAG